MPKTEITFHSPAIFSGQTGEVDVSNCVIKGVSLITGDCVAEGHDLHVDGTTVTQLHELAKARGKVPVNLDHGSGIKDMNGFVDNFRMDGEKLRGDWHLLTSHAETPLMLERAEKMPECFGLSVAFKGKGVASGPGKKAARAEKLLSVDCVTRPAANAGLFSVPVDINKKVMNEIPPAEPTLQDVLGAIGQIGERLDQYEQVQNQLVEAHNQSAQGEGDEPLTQEQVHAELSRLVNLTDEQLAAEGIQRADVDRAVSEYNAAVEAGAGEHNDPSGQDGQQGNPGVEAAAPAMAGAGAAELAAIKKDLIQLKAGIAADKAKLVEQAETMEFQALEGKMVTLAEMRDRAVELAERLVVENEALRFHMKTGTRPVKGQFVTDEFRLMSAGDNGELHPFQLSVKNIQEAKAGRSYTEAIQLAMKEPNGAAMHADWLQNQSRTIRA